MPDKRRTAKTASPEELDEESQVTPRVEREADLDAERFGTPLFRSMLDATPDEEPDGRPPL